MSRIFNESPLCQPFVAYPLPVRAGYCADLLYRFELKLAEGQNDKTREV